jgi:hypothetical protein
LQRRSHVNSNVLLQTHQTTRYHEGRHPNIQDWKSVRFLQHIHLIRLTIPLHPVLEKRSELDRLHTPRQPIAYLHMCKRIRANRSIITWSPLTHPFAKPKLGCVISTGFQVSIRGWWDGGWGVGFFCQILGDYCRTCGIYNRSCTNPPFLSFCIVPDRLLTRF